MDRTRRPTETLSSASARSPRYSLAACWQVWSGNGTVHFTDPLQKHLGWEIKIPQKDGKEIRLMDLVTHSSGLPREAERAPSPRTTPLPLSPRKHSSKTCRA